MLRQFTVKIRRQLTRILIGSEVTDELGRLREMEATITDLSNSINKHTTRMQQLEHDMVKYMHQDKYEEWLADKYYSFYNKRLDFENPKTFNEKIQWIKLYGADDLQTELADKYLVKDYIKKHIGEEYVVPLLGVYDKFDDINFDELPDRFVIKTNNASRSNIIVKSKAELDIKTARRKVNHWLQQSQFTYGLEMHYKNINPKVIIEEYLEFQEGVEDYKFYCFNGKPDSLLVIADRFTEEKMAFYDMNFKKQEFSILPGMKDLNIEKPEKFEQLFELTTKLAKELNYPFVRIDWYIDKFGKVYFGEFTFNPGAGWYFFKPEKYNKLWGDKITLPKVRNRIP